MTEKEISLGRLFVREAVKAGTWGFIFLLVMGMLTTTIKQDIKEGIASGVERLVSKAIIYATDPVMTGLTKQLVKEGIEFSVATAARELIGVIEEKPMDNKVKEKAGDQKP